MKFVLVFMLLAMSLATIGADNNLSGSGTSGLSYGDGMFGKAVKVGRILKKVKLTSRATDTSGMLLFDPPYRQYQQENLKSVPPYITIYKEDSNGLVTNNTTAWTPGSGNRMSCPIEKFEKTATYYADYLVFDYVYFDLSNSAGRMERGTLEFFAAPAWKYPQVPVDAFGLFTIIGKQKDGELLRNHIERRGNYLAYKLISGNTPQVDVNITDYSNWEPGIFKHCALTWDDKEYKFYIDGVLTSQGKQPKYDAALQELIVGSLRDSPPNISGLRFFGMIDELRLSDIPRSAKEIEQSAKGLNPFTVDQNTVIICHFDGNLNYEKR